MIPNRVRVEFRDFFSDFDPEDNFLVRALGQLTRVEVGPDADLCFFSDFGDILGDLFGCDSIKIFRAMPDGETPRLTSRSAANSSGSWRWSPYAVYIRS